MLDIAPRTAARRRHLSQYRRDLLLHERAFRRPLLVAILMATPDQPALKAAWQQDVQRLDAKWRPILLDQPSDVRHLFRQHRPARSTKQPAPLPQYADQYRPTLLEVVHIHEVRLANVRLAEDAVLRLPTPTPWEDNVWLKSPEGVAYTKGLSQALRGFHDLTPHFPFLLTLLRSPHPADALPATTEFNHD